MITSGTWYVVIFGAFFLGFGFAAGAAVFNAIIALLKGQRG